MSDGRRPRGRRGIALAFALPLAAGTGLACTEDAERPPEPPRVRAAVPKEKADTRFMRIRALLELPPQNRRRATQLFGLVRPLCDDDDAQAEFLDTAAWSVSKGSRTFYLPIALALDVFEHVTAVCARFSNDGTRRLLDGARPFLEGEARFHVLVARTRALGDDLDGATAAAHRAAELGSAHAVALSATLEARKARARGPGYVEGMYEPAIAVASAEPTKDWAPVDLAAVLATRARLLLEKGLWAPPDAASAARRRAVEVLERILAGPFPTMVRQRTSDALCFESADLGLGLEPCERAGAAFGHVGARVVADLVGRAPAAGEEGALDPVTRRAGLARLAARLATLPEGRLVVVIFRGDESELREWARPAARLLERLGARSADLLLVDRTRSPRAGALVQRILDLAGAEPWRTVEAGEGTQTVPCVAALLGGRQAPEACPLSPEDRRALVARARPPAFALLVGRDLDAEIDDLRLYEHPVVLASFRRSEMERKGLEAWLKSLSDVLAVVPPAP